MRMKNTRTQEHKNPEWKRNASGGIILVFLAPLVLGFFKKITKLK